MDFVDLHANLREETGKGFNKKLRAKGLVPAVLYKKGEKATSLKIDRKNLLTILHSAAGENVIIKLHIGGAKTKSARTVIIKETQKDPVRDDMLHIDLQEISLTEKLKVNVAVKAKGEAIGVKQDGGVLQYVLWELELECLPTNIPGKIEADVSNLKIGDAIHVKDLPLIEGVRILNNPEDVVFIVEHPKAVEEVVAEPVEGEAQEPEVIKEKKPKVDEEAAIETEKPAGAKKEKEEDKK